MDVSVEQVARWINRPPVDPPVADNLARLLADARVETQQNDDRQRFNSSCCRVEDLQPYSNRAYLALVDALDHILGLSRG